MAKMKITCDEATMICDKSQYGEASLLEKIKLSIHFIYCRVCALYTKQNGEMTKICNAVKDNHQDGDKVPCLSNDMKEKMKEQFKNIDLKS